MKICGEVNASQGLVGFVPGVFEVVGPKVEGGAEGVVTAWCVARTVPARFHDVDFSARRPASILVVCREHPYGGPQPVPARELCAHFHLAVRKREAFGGADAGRGYGVKVISPGSRGPKAAVIEVTGAGISWGASPHVHDKIVPHHVLIANLIGEEGGLYVQDAVLYVAVAAVVRVVLELPVAASRQRDLVLPQRQVEIVEVVL